MGSSTPTELAGRDATPAASNRRQIVRTYQRRLVEVLRHRGEHILTRDDGWVTLTRSDRGGCYHIGPRGQLRIGDDVRHRAISAPWIARRLLAA